MATQMHTRVLTAHAPLPLAEKVDEVATRLERPRGWAIKQALDAWIAQEEARDCLTLEALADVDASNVINQKTVQAWAESLSSAHPMPLPVPHG